MSTSKFKISTDARGEFRFNLVATNGQVILSSEGYKAKASCMNGIGSVRKNAVLDERYERKQTKNGQHMFNLKAGNGEIIGTSEAYASEDGRDNGIDSVKRNAPAAEVVEA
ncbi:MAG: YegP family protein [Flavobacteriales bacterium]